MPQYIVLMEDDGSYFKSLTPEQLQEFFQRFRAWSGALRDKGILKGGQKLNRGAGRTLRRSPDKSRIIDGPFTESKEVLGGFFIIEAADLDHAAEIVRDCPHLDYGAIHLRLIDPT